MKINCIIVDDEPLARKGLMEYVSEVDFLELKSECGNPLEANKIIREQKIDLIFLDIQMPKLSGIDFLKTIHQPPIVIFTTAYSEYAVQGYEMDIIDYLLKPISFERFLKAVNKAKDFFELKNNNQANIQIFEYFFVRCDKGFEKIDFDDLLLVESMENYVILKTKTKKIIAYLTLKAVEDYLPPDKFIKVHKSFIVSISKIDNIIGNEIKIGSHFVPVSRYFKDKVMDKIVNDKLLKR